MSFNDDAKIDSSRVRTSRGRGGKVAIGGGGLLVLVVAALLGINPQMLEDLGLAGDTGQTQDGETSQGVSQCTTGKDANRDASCRIAATAQSLDAFWVPYLGDRGVQLENPGVEIFSSSVSTGCGNATTAVGPFYCPSDQVAYFDTGFFSELRDTYGSDGGPLAEEYVVAHEYGHHVQNAIGTLSASQKGGTGPTSGSVRVELQADCFAGLWASYATQTQDASGQPLLEPLTQQDLRSALSAASAVGDDRIQKASSGRVSPEGWTHGSSKQRQAWFMSGYSSGDINRCNTLEAKDLDHPSS